MPPSKDSEKVDHKNAIKHKNLGSSPRFSHIPKRIWKWLWMCCLTLISFFALSATNNNRLPLFYEHKMIIFVYQTLLKVLKYFSFPSIKNNLSISFFATKIVYFFTLMFFNLKSQLLICFSFTNIKNNLSSVCIFSTKIVFFTLYVFLALSLDSNKLQKTKQLGSFVSWTTHHFLVYHCFIALLNKIVFFI
jgi:hypothetical protein